MSWWRTWQDRAEPSLPRLVFESDRRTRRRGADDHAARVRQRLAGIYAREVDLRRQLGLPAPPTGRPRNPTERGAVSIKGRLLREFEDLLLEWDWDFNGDLDPLALPAGSKVRVAWRCLLDPEHVWETRVVDRTSKATFCPFHMGNRVHPAQSLAAHYPWLAREWHPTRNVRRPDEVSRASAREVIWRCAQGHEWRAVVYSRTLSKSACPECYKLEATTRSLAGRERARRSRELQAEAHLTRLTPLDALALTS
jgi:hypothetical protein